MIKKVKTTWQGFSQGTRFQALFYSAIGVIGFLFITASISNKFKTYESAFVGLGIAFLASSLIGFAQRLFFFDDFKNEMHGLVDASLNRSLSKTLFHFLSHGVEGLHTNREEGINSIKKSIEQEKNEIIIIGSSLMGLFDVTEVNVRKKAFADSLRKKIEAGIKVKFLLTHPALAFLREDAENARVGSIRDDIISMVQYLKGEYLFNNKNVGLKVPAEDIYLYHGTPTLFVILTSTRMIINPYTYCHNAFENFCFEIAKKDEKHDLIAQVKENHFDIPTGKVSMVTRLDNTTIENIKKITITNLFAKKITGCENRKNCWKREVDRQPIKIKPSVLLSVDNHTFSDNQCYDISKNGMKIQINKVEGMTLNKVYKASFTAHDLDNVDCELKWLSNSSDGCFAGFEFVQDLPEADINKIIS